MLAKPLKSRTKPLSRGNANFDCLSFHYSTPFQQIFHFKVLFLISAISTQTLLFLFLTLSPSLSGKHRKVLTVPCVPCLHQGAPHTQHSKLMPTVRITIQSCWTSHDWAASWGLPHSDHQGPEAETILRLCNSRQSTGFLQGHQGFPGASEMCISFTQQRRTGSLLCCNCCFILATCVRLGTKIFTCNPCNQWVLLKCEHSASFQVSVFTGHQHHQCF